MGTELTAVTGIVVFSILEVRNSPVDGRVLFGFNGPFAIAIYLVLCTFVACLVTTIFKSWLRLA